VTTYKYPLSESYVIADGNEYPTLGSVDTRVVRLGMGAMSLELDDEEEEEEEEDDVGVATVVVMTLMDGVSFSATKSTIRFGSNAIKDGVPN
jgi:hypothetical protein